MNSESLQPPPSSEAQAEASHVIERLLRDFERTVEDTEKTLAALDEGLPFDPHAADARRELARQLVVGAWLNRNNPEWNPSQPETNRPDPEDPLFAILQGLQSDA